MEIVIIKLSAIGDVIHTLPALELLHRHFPESRITWVVEEKAAGIVSGHPSINKVIVSKRKQWIADLRMLSRWYPVFKEVRFFLRELRATNYDLVIDFQGLFKSAILVLLSRGVRKVGYDKTRELSYLVLTHKISSPPMDQHAVTRNIGLVNALCQLSSEAQSPFPGAYTTTAFYAERAHTKTPSLSSMQHIPDGFIIAIGEGDRRNVECLLQDVGIGELKPLVVVNAPAGWETKRWEMQKMAALSDRLIERYDAHLIYTGTSNDSPYINAILSFMEHPAVNAAGRTSLKELACLMKRADLLITTDSGPMHLASAMGTPLVAIFGPTAPWRTGPYSAHAQILRQHVPCGPCFKKKCSSMMCMHGIGVEDVIESVEKLMGVRKTKGDTLQENVLRGYSSFDYKG